MPIIPATQGAEGGGPHGQGQPGQFRKTPLQIKKKEEPGQPSLPGKSQLSGRDIVSKNKMGVGQTAQHVKALAAKSKDPTQVSGTHMVDGEN